MGSLFSQQVYHKPLVYCPVHVSLLSCRENTRVLRYTVVVMTSKVHATLQKPYHRPRKLICHTGSQHRPMNPSTHLPVWTHGYCYSAAICGGSRMPFSPPKGNTRPRSGEIRLRQYIHSSTESWDRRTPSSFWWLLALVIHRPSNSTAISPGPWGVQDAVLEDGKMAAKCTAQQRAEILRLAQEVGPLEAAKRKGVPPGTVTAWRCLENKRAKLAKPPEPPEPQKPAVSEPPKRLTGKKVARLYTPSEKAAALELVQQLGVSETHRKTGISRFSLYEWARIHEKAMQQKHLSDPLADQTPAKNDRDALVFAPTRRRIAPTRRRIAPTFRGIAPTLWGIAPTFRGIAPTRRGIAPTRSTRRKNRKEFR